MLGVEGSMNTGAALFDTTTAPAVIPPAGIGGISGGLLRPGSIDQGAFVRELQAQQATAQANRAAAGVGGQPVPLSTRTVQDGIPTLSSAQFAALLGAQSVAKAAGSGAAAADGSGESQVPAAPQVQALQAAAVPIKLSGLRAPTQSGTAGTSMPDARSTASDDATDAPSFSRAGGAGSQLASAATAEAGDTPQFTRRGDGSTESAQTAAVPTSGDADPSGAKPGSADSKTSDADPQVVHLKSPPDKDQQIALRMQGKRWVVDETPGSRQLFFGPDGEFGWDDFLDVINPLQHIPIVAQLYRAATGDQISGAAELLGSLPIGPLGPLSMLGAIADVAVKDVTGRDVGDNLVAMIFGKDDTPAAQPDGSMAAEAAPGSSRAAQIAGRPENAEAGSGSSNEQVASSGFVAAEASAQHADCRG
jgi:hypothetical protein